VKILGQRSHEALESWHPARRARRVILVAALDAEAKPRQDAERLTDEIEPADAAHLAHAADPTMRVGIFVDRRLL
jgi:hypothetical protein